MPVSRVQGLYLFVAWLIVDWVISPALRFSMMGMGRAFTPLGGLLHLLLLAAWIVMLVKVSHQEHYRLPIIGEMAEAICGRAAGGGLTSPDVYSEWHQDVGQHSLDDDIATLLNQEIRRSRISFKGSR